jgi:hypothetical protein
VQNKPKKKIESKNQREEFCCSVFARNEIKTVA